MRQYTHVIVVFTDGMGFGEGIAVRSLPTPQRSAPQIPTQSKVLKNHFLFLTCFVCIGNSPQTVGRGSRTKAES